ncbi:unnamed protein product, partial [marine sediment metagenome]
GIGQQWSVNKIVTKEKVKEELSQKDKILEGEQELSEEEKKLIRRKIKKKKKKKK